MCVIYPSALQIWTLKEINKFKSTHLNTLYSLPQDINKASSSVMFFLKSLDTCLNKNKEQPSSVVLRWHSFKFLNFWSIYTQQLGSIISQGSNECLDSSRVEINDKVNEIKLTSMEFQSGPKFWWVNAAGQTAGLCHPYGDLIYQNQAPILKCI